MKKYAIDLSDGTTDTIEALRWAITPGAWLMFYGEEDEQLDAYPTGRVERVSVIAESKKTDWDPVRITIHSEIKTLEDVEEVAKITERIIRDSARLGIF